MKVTQVPETPVVLPHHPAAVGYGTQRWLLPIVGLMALLGYFGPWIPHEAAGLVVTGLDLGEIVKFLHPVQHGLIRLWRTGFYLPLVAVSVAFSLSAFRPELDYRWVIRLGLLGVAAAAALNLLPPAWTPDRLIHPEFRQQTAALILCLGLTLISPLLGLLPRRIATIAISALALLAIWFPLFGLFRVLPTLAEIYNRPPAAGWGPWCMAAGLLGLALVTALPKRERPKGSL
jgi:hypothetical protein